MIGLGTAAAQLDTSVNIAFPAITRAFDVSIGDIQWVVICYVLTYASLLLALGRIGDTVGHALVFRIGLIWTTIALLLVGWSPNFGAMLFFRCLQGIGAALVLNCGAALVTSLYGEERRISTVMRFGRHMSEQFRFCPPPEATASTSAGLRGLASEPLEPPQAGSTVLTSSATPTGRRWPTSTSRMSRDAVNQMDLLP